MDDLCEEWEIQPYRDPCRFASVSACASCMRRITLTFEGRSAEVGWYEGSSELSIRKSIGAALRVAGERVVLTDNDGNAVPLDDSLRMPTKATISLVDGDAASSAPPPLPRESMLRRLQNEKGSGSQFSDLIGRTMTSDLPDDPAFQVRCAGAYRGPRASPPYILSSTVSVI